MKSYRTCFELPSAMSDLCQIRNVSDREVMPLRLLGKSIHHLNHSGLTSIYEVAEFRSLDLHCDIVRGICVRAKFSSGSPRGGSRREQFRFGLGRQPIGRMQQDYESERSSRAD